MPRGPVRWILLFVVFLACVGWYLTRNRCVSVWFSHGLEVAQCPDGALRPITYLNAGRIRRGEDARIYVSMQALYTVGTADAMQSTPIEKFTATLTLIDRNQHETPLVPTKEWIQDSAAMYADVAFPKVPDGDYRLRASTKSTVGESSVEAPLALYAPARIHVLTDRPLYEPGNTIKFRAVVLRARDLVPLDGRPGTWIVTDPQGETVLEERVPAGEWGVTSGSFPLDRSAPDGLWHVSYRSGGAVDDVTVDVHPFTLPRFRLETTTSKPFYGSGEKPAVEGRVVYSSGAPVAKAEVEITWTVDGEWPAPTEWLDHALPKHATCDAAGKFSLTLPPIPGDLRGQSNLRASLAALDKAGDRVESSANVLLSEDAIQVSPVTELSGGLVGGFNNRLFLRTSDAAGRLLPSATLLVKRAWDASDKGTEITPDEDGVASLQLDPGPAVNVVIPPMPVRLPPKRRVVSRGDAEELLNGNEATLADQRVFDSWLLALTPCARFVAGSASVRAAVRIDRAGAITAVAAPEGGLGSCVADVLKTTRFPAGSERLYAVPISLEEPELASLSPDLNEAPASRGELAAAVNEAARDARPCVPEDVQNGTWARQLTFRLKKGSKEISTGWVAVEGGITLPAEPTACIERKLAKLTIAEAAKEDSLGTIRFGLSPSPRVEAVRPQATTFLGYELRVVAKVAGKEVGSTLVRLGEGSVPQLRLRATPILAKAGDTVKLELIRGPGFRGELPEELVLSSPAGAFVKSKVDRKARSTSFELPANAEGWWSVSAAGAVARVFVRSAVDLQVTVSPDKAKHAPGDKATLAVQTTSGGKGHPAAVGLFGVDDSLSQLATLLGPDDFARVRPKVPMDRPAFPGLDAQALVLGRVRGANAAAAIVLGAGASETPEDLDITTSATAAGSFDPSLVLVDRFYAVLGELHRVVRAWEKSAPAGDQLHPPMMAKFWVEARDVAAKKGLVVTDAWDRPLRIVHLPGDLRALVDPRQVVVEGTRLPEDVEDWNAYVAKERP